MYILSRYIRSYFYNHFNSYFNQQETEFCNVDKQQYSVNPTFSEARNFQRLEGSKTACAQNIQGIPKGSTTLLVRIW